MSNQGNALLSDKIAGGIWGLLVGDAMGVPYEFQQPEDLDHCFPYQVLGLQAPAEEFYAFYGIL